MAAIVFREDQPGILTIENRVDIGWVLAPEPLLDFSQQTQNCDLIKGTLDIAPITDANFRQLFLQMVEENCTVNVNVGTHTYGHLTQLSSNGSRLEEAYMNTIAYNCTLNLFGDDKRHLRQLVGADQWIENEGILPITHPLWACRSTPEFSIFGPGARDSLAREKHQLGLVYCVLKGRQTFTVISKGPNTLGMCEDLRRQLQDTLFPQETLQCPNWLQHGKLYCEPEFLCNNYGAKTVELTAGQFVIVQSGVYIQKESVESGLVVSNSCLPRSWLNAASVDECEHITPVLTMSELNKMRENANMVKNQVARTLLLNSMGQTRAIIEMRQRTYPQRVARIHNTWGRYPVVGRRNINRRGGANRGGANRGGARRGTSVVVDEPRPVLQQAPDDDSEQ